MRDKDVLDYKRVSRYPPYMPLRRWKNPKNDVSQITVQDFLHEYAKDLYCQQEPPVVGLTGFSYRYDKNGFLTRITPIDGAI